MTESPELIQTKNCGPVHQGTPRVSIAVLGCRLNQYESRAVLGQFLRCGFREVSFEEPADLVIVDTCAVTRRAEQKARQLIRSAIRAHAGAVIAVCGCYGQRDAARIARIPGVDFVLGTREKLDLPAWITELCKQDPPVIRVSDPAAPRSEEFMAAESFGGLTRALLKIQDGCDIFCSFCVVPHLRGRSRSMPRESILRQARLLLDRGYRELVLSGVHIGGYGKDRGGGENLAELCRILLDLDGLERLRLSSIEPWDIDEELIRAMAGDPRFCPHFHTAIQSGSNRILGRMRRRIDSAGLYALFERLADEIPDLGLGTDVMAGFPGEEEHDFRETVEMIHRVPFTYLHVFPYSRREGTRAAGFEGQVESEVLRRRCGELRALGREKRSAFHTAHLGRRISVLLESGPGGENLQGYTANYLRVRLPAPVGKEAGLYQGSLLEVELLEDLGATVRGRMVP